MRSLVIALTTFVLAVPVQGQVARGNDVQASFGHVDASVDTLHEEGTRSEGAALALSLLGGPFGVHGVGSYYAGHSGHGTRHLLIGFGTIGVAALALASCDGWLFGECSSGAETMAGVAVLGYLFNWGWATVTAVRDVRERNERVRGASLDFAPQLSLSPARHSVRLPGGSVATPRATIRVLRVGF